MDFSRNHGLILDLKNSTFLPMFNYKIFDEITEEQMNILKDIKQASEWDKSQDAKKNQTDIKVFMRLKFDQYSRNKRVQLAYQNYRIDKIVNEFWKQGGALNKEQLQYLHNDEKKYLDDYTNLIHEYENILSKDNIFNLSKDLTPPAQVYIQVRVVKSTGQVVTRDGSIIDLKEGTQHFVKKSDVEQFIMNGSLIVVD